jgi:DNA-binding HxlR family transcriptional regulator
MTSRKVVPGAPVRGSHSGRPIMALLDLLGRRWTLRVLWELAHSPSPPAFRELQRRCSDVSSSVLSLRLRELRDAGIVDADNGYELTELGQALLESLEPLSAWAARWADELGDEASSSGTSRPARHSG